MAEHVITQHLGTSLPDIHADATTLYINECPNLTSLTGVPVWIRNLVIIKCGALTNLAGLQVGIESLRVSQCGRLSSLHGMPNSVTSLKLAVCDGLANLNGLSNRLIVVEIRLCDNLMTSRGIPANVLTLELSHCPKVTRLDDLPDGITSLQIGGCENLLSLAGTPQTVTSLTCSGCTSLTNFVGVPEGCEWLDARYCTGITSFDGLPSNLGNVYVGGCTGLRLEERYREAIVRVERKMDSTLSEYETWLHSNRRTPEPAIRLQSLKQCVDRFIVEINLEMPKHIPTQISIYNLDNGMHTAYGVAWYWRNRVKSHQPFDDNDFVAFTDFVNIILESNYYPTTITLIPDNLLVALLKWVPPSELEVETWTIRDVITWVRRYIRTSRPHILDAVNYANSGMERSLMTRGYVSEKTSNSVEVHAGVAKYAIPQLISSYLPPRVPSETEQSGRTIAATTLRQLSVRAKNMDPEALARELDVLAKLVRQYAPFRPDPSLALPPSASAASASASASAAASSTHNASIKRSRHLLD